METDVTQDQINADLTIKPIKAKGSTPKIRVYTEDAEAAEFAKYLLGTKYTKLLKFVDVSIGCKQLLTLHGYKIPEFTENLIILDGDQRSSAKNIISLPDSGQKFPPDQLLYHFLKELPESDDFWPGFKEMGGYTKQSCFLDYPNLNPSIVEVRKQYKDWYKSQKEYWGRGSSKAYGRWKSDYSEQVSNFLEAFRKAYNYLAKKNDLPQI